MNILSVDLEEYFESALYWKRKSQKSSRPISTCFFLHMSHISLQFVVLLVPDIFVIVHSFLHRYTQVNTRNDWYVCFVSFFSSFHGVFIFFTCFHYISISVFASTSACAMQQLIWSIGVFLFWYCAHCQPQARCAYKLICLYSSMLLIWMATEWPDIIFHGICKYLPCKAHR